MEEKLHKHDWHALENGPTFNGYTLGTNHAHHPAADPA